MKKSPQRAKWILALVCLVLAFCLVQRSFNLPTAPVVQLSAAASAHDDGAGGDKLCTLSAKSLNAAAPILDSAIPLLLMLLALIATLFQPVSLSGYWREPLFPPLRRRHLTFCVFRE